MEQDVQVAMYVMDVASLHSIKKASQWSQCQRTMTKRFEDIIVLESTEFREMATTKLNFIDDYKISLYFPVLVAMISELHSS